MNDLRRLVAAPELLVCNLADHALDVLVRALLVEHPALADEASYKSRVGRRARDVVRGAARLRRALLTYRLAVDDTLDEIEHDLPF